MPIGMFYQMQIPKPWTTESETQRYGEMLAQVEYAEGMGFESVWVVEHHFRAEWSHSSAPDVTLGALSHWQGYDISKLPASYRWHYQRALADAARQDETSSLDLIRRGGRFCIGDPDDCIRYLELYEAMGLDEIMPLFQVGPISHGEVMETLRLSGKYVIPYFQAKARGSVG
jgi:alkanesulfonate monooxygenase SsuD/methylene tetrahydromethanopterin reductase-like flavin-dependent oxidoreductase (luciferase family)